MPDKSIPNMKKRVLTALAVMIACIATAQENTDYPGALQISALRDKALLQRIASSEKPSVGTPEYESLMQEISDKSLTAVRRDHNLPLKKFEKSAFLAFNADENTKYIADRLAENGVEVFLFPEGTPDEVFYNIRYKLNDYNKIVVCYHAGDSLCADGTRRAKTKPDKLQFKMYASLGVRHGNIGVYFGDPTDLDAFDRDLKDFDVLIVGYEDTKYNCKAAAKIILGEIKPEGVLPVETKHFKKGTSK